MSATNFGEYTFRGEVIDRRVGEYIKSLQDENLDLRERVAVLTRESSREPE